MGKKEANRYWGYSFCGHKRMQLSDAINRTNKPLFDEQWKMSQFTQDPALFGEPHYPIVPGRKRAIWTIFGQAIKQKGTQEATAQVTRLDLPPPARSRAPALRSADRTSSASRETRKGGVPLIGVPIRHLEGKQTEWFKESWKETICLWPGCSLFEKSLYPVAS